MKKVLAIIIALIAVSSCVKQTVTTEEKTTTQLEQFVDSMKKIYPNYIENIAVNNKICKAFASDLTTIPGILEGEDFHIVGIGEIGGIYRVMLASNGIETSVSVWCEDFGEAKAAALDIKKLYRLTGGTVEKIVPTEGASGHFLDLGNVYVKDLTVEEIPGSHYENPIGL